MRLKTTIIYLILLIPTLARGDGFELFGRQDDLKMTVIADVGEAEKISAPFGKFSARDIIKINGSCFEPLGSIGSWGYSRKAAFVVVDQAKNVKIATLENGIGSVKVDVISVIQVDCSSNASVDFPGDPEKLLEVLRKGKKLFKRNLSGSKARSERSWAHVTCATGRRSKKAKVKSRRPAPSRSLLQPRRRVQKQCFRQRSQPTLASSPHHEQQRRSWRYRFR